MENNLFIMKYLWKYSRSNVIIRLLSTLTAPIEPFVFIVSMKLVVDGIAEGQDLEYLLAIILVAFTAWTITAIFNAWINYSSSAKAQRKISKGIQDELLKKSLTLDLSCYDDAEYYDKYVRAMQEAENRAGEVLDTIVGIISSTLALLTVITLVVMLSPVVILFVIVVLWLQILLNKKRNKVVFNHDMELTRPDREADYSRRIFYNPVHAQEMRMGKLGPLMNKRFNSSMDQTLKVIKKYCGKFVFFDSAFNILGFGFMTFMMAFSTWQITIGALTIGDFTALINGSSQLLQHLTKLFNQFPKLAQNSMYIENLRSVLEYEPKVSSIEDAFSASTIKHNSIEIRNLSFAYPHSDTQVLKNINLSIEHGSKTAIVGYNGVGKSTLVKMLLRFYDPSSGQILLHDADYKNFEINSLRSKFGVVFQNYSCYALSVAENVLLEDIESVSQESSVIDALKYCGLYDKIASFDKGIHTNLSREFDSEGIPLSGGEQQKIAIARAFVENKDILILDEPSSALDPKAEYDINQKITQLAKDKTVLFISHRLSTVRMADMIYMIDNGEVIESGNHDELMKLSGKYCEMFNMQAQNYVEV